jgi:hypothetical protein
VHQLCCQHLLRDLAGAAELYPDAHWPDQIADALRGLIHQTNLARDAGRDTIEPSVHNKLIKLFTNGVKVELSDTTSHDNRSGERKTRLLLEVLRDRQADVLRFAHDLRVPATSNQAERDLRPSKIQQKISGLDQRSPHPRPLQDPRLPLHRRHTRPQCDGRPARGDPRPPLDTTRPHPSLTHRVDTRAARHDHSRGHHTMPSCNKTARHRRG